MSNLKNKVIFITGASRGIGHAIALRAAKDGAKIVVVAKTTEPHPSLPGTIYTVAQDIEKLGGESLAIKTDIRDESQVIAAVQETIKKFGKIDILINNASAIMLSNTLKTPLKKADLMFDVNVRASFAVSQACLPYLLKSDNPHILNISPPLNMDAKWFADHSMYTISKYGMSMLVLGMAAEFKEQKISINALWPKTTIATSAVKMLGGEALMNASRKPSIMADAVHWIITQKSKEYTGNFFIDEEIIINKLNCKDLNQYSFSNKLLASDLFID